VGSEVGLREGRVLGFVEGSLEGIVEGSWEGKRVGGVEGSCVGLQGSGHSIMRICRPSKGMGSALVDHTLGGGVFPSLLLGH
jgi:hypothetical protein